MHLLTSKNEVVSPNVCLLVTLLFSRRQKCFVLHFLLLLDAEKTVIIKWKILQENNLINTVLHSRIPTMKSFILRVYLYDL